MDVATLIGLVFGFIATGGGMLFAAAHAKVSLIVFADIASLLIVVGGMLASTSVAFPLPEVMKLGTALGAVFRATKTKLGDLVEESVRVSEIARRGNVELERGIGTIQNPFFRDAVQMVLDGYSLEELTEIMNTRIDYRETREKSQVDLLKTMGAMGPAWGMIGTLMGLVIMLSGFGEGGGGMESIGVGMAASLITTFYGALSAYLFFLPMAAKINSRIGHTSTGQALMLEAARLIHQKKHPLIVREKLNAFIPPKEWKRGGK